MATSNLGDTASSMARSNSEESDNKCHFLDTFLPELRLAVYEELLLYDEDDPEKEVHPQILATCTFINKEAQDILSVKNLKTTMLVRLSISETERPTVRHGMAPPESIRPAEKLSKEVSMFKHLPPQTRRAVIELEISNGRHDSIARAHLGPMTSRYKLEEGMRHARFQLYLIISQIQESAAVKRVTLKIRFRGDIDDADKLRYLTFLLFPIRHLAHTDLLSIRGIESTSLRNLLVEPLETKIPFRFDEAILTTTTLVKWVRVDQEIRALSELFTAAGMHNTGIQYLFTTLTETMQAPGAPYHMRDDDYIHQEGMYGARASAAMRLLREGAWKELRLQAEARLREAGEDAQTQT